MPRRGNSVPGRRGTKPSGQRTGLNNPTLNTKNSLQQPLGVRHSPKSLGVTSRGASKAAQARAAAKRPKVK